MASTNQIGLYRIQERNMIVPDGAKVWVVLDTTGKVVFSGKRHAALHHAAMLNTLAVGRDGMSQKGTP